MKQMEPIFSNMLQSLEDCSIQFQGFRPSDFARSFLRDKIESIHEEAPYGSKLKALFTRKDRLFKGVVTITSAAGPFFAVASGRHMRDVVYKLVTQLRKQLNRWKSQRFNNNRLKEVNYDTNHVA